MDFIYTAIIAKIKANATIFTDNGLQTIATIDRFKGQYINPELHQPYARPALFVGFKTQWKDVGNLNQKGDTTVTLHLELENSVAESADGSPDQEVALQDFTYMSVLNALIHGMAGNQYSRLMRKTTDEDEEPLQTNVTLITYDTEVTDNSAERYKDYIEVPLDDMITTKVPHVSNTPPEPGNKYVID